MCLVQAIHMVVFHGREAVCSFLRASVQNCLYDVRDHVCDCVCDCVCEHVCEPVWLWM